MLDPGSAAVETGPPANLKVVTRDCLFAPVGGPPVRSGLSGSVANRRGVVIRARAEQPDGGLQLSVPPGRTNAYYNVDPLGTLNTTLTFEDCKDAAPDIVDAGRAELKQRPWATQDPLTAATADTSPWKGFRLKVETDPAVFTTDKRPVPLGVAFYNPADNVRRAYADIAWGFARPRTAAEARVKLWWPSAKDDELTPGTFNDLRNLLKTTRPDDIILIRHTGECPLDTEEIKSVTKPSEGDLRLTFKPEEGSRPVLVVKDDNERDQTLFKLKSGEVTFEGIHFQLKPNRPKDGQLVAAVSILGGKSCTFKNCLFTLAEEEDSKVAAVHLPDIDKVMAMDPAMRPVPKVVFDHCLVRGKGRGVWVEVSRPLHLEMTDSLTALDGPVVLAEAGGKPVPGAAGSAKFTRVTMLTGGSVIEMRGGKTTDAMRASGLPTLKVDTDKCLFVAVPFAGRPLVDLDGVDPADWKVVLTWQVTEGNRYANFESGADLAIIRPGGDGTPKVWTRDDWIGNISEPPGADKRFGQVTFTTPVTGLKDLPALKPADLVTRTVDFPDLSGAKTLDVGVDPTVLKEKLKLSLPDEPKP
jgi:hypothetical protein